MRTAARIGRIQPFHVMALLARARELEASGRDVVHMEIGEPDFPTPAPVVEAGREALMAGHTRYTPALGLPALREAISGYYGERFATSVDPSRIVITPGSSVGLQMVMAALVDIGDEVLLTDPGYPCNRTFVHLAEGSPQPLPVSETMRFRPTASQAEEKWTDRTKALMVASPANPTGTVLPPALVGELADLARDHDGTLIVDEIYQGLTYGAEDHTAVALERENVVVVNSFSKYFGMTGWRVGWLVVPDLLVPVMEKLAQNMYLSAPTIAQHAAITALAPATRPLLDERRDEFRRRRDFLYDALPPLGFRLGESPEGAFYLYADCSELAGDSYAFASDLLEAAGVAVTPGKDFGLHRPETHVRFAFTTDIRRLREGVDRIQRYLRGRH